MEIGEANTIFEKILNDNLIINNANISLLIEFITLWTDITFDDGTLLLLVKDWFKKVRSLHQQQKLNHVTHLTSALLLEKVLSKIDIDSGVTLETVTQMLLLVNEIMTAYFKNLEKMIYENDAFVAFYRLHLLLSKKKKGVEIIKKYNLWKKLLHFYLKSNKLNLRIQNTCTEYINNLVLADLPLDVTSFTDSVHICIQYIKTGTDGREKLSNQMLFRSVRLLQHLLLRNVFHVEKSTVHNISKHFVSCLPYIQHLLVSCGESAIICYSLKIYVLVKCFFINAKEDRNDNETATLLISTLQQVVSENSKLNSYVPEILGMDFNDAAWQPQWKTYLIYLQIASILSYARYLNINVKYELHLHILKIPKKFESFVNQYQGILERECCFSNTVNDVLKNIGFKIIPVEHSRMYLILFELIFQSTNESSNATSDELYSFLLNIVHASLTILSEDANLTNPEILNNFLITIIGIAQSKSRFSLVLRLLAFRLCCLIVKRLEVFSNNVVEVLRTTIVQGFDDSDWEIRDSALELLNGTLVVLPVENETLLKYEDVCRALMKARVDHKSSVRTSAYTVIISALIKYDKHVLDSYLNCDELIHNIADAFHDETEDDVREQMITVIFRFWNAVHISDNLLLKIYGVVYDASHNDLNSDIRRKGMFFWYSLVAMVTESSQGKDFVEVSKIIEGLSRIGCLQAVVDGIEDEYDQEVTKIAFNIVKKLRTVILSEKANDSSNIEILELKNNTENHYSNKLPGLIDKNSNYIDSKSFLNKYSNVDIYELEKAFIHNDVFDLKSFLDCFSDINNSENDVNLKDCY